MNDSSDDAFPLENLDWSSWPSAPSGLRTALLEETSKLVRRRARRRRWRLAGGWGLAYAAGMATVWLSWSRDREPAAPPPEQVTERAQTTAREAQGPALSENLAALSPEDLSPEDLRSRVADAPRPEQIRLLRMAGDRYLFGSVDVESALDCYRQVIELTPEGELKKSAADDSWLLAELKLSAAASAPQIASD